MDELNSIMLGGDAFITKPYHTAILLAKIDSLLKRAYPGSKNNRMTYNGVSLHIESGKLEANGQETELTKMNERSCIICFLMREKSAAGQI